MAVVLTLNGTAHHHPWHFNGPVATQASIMRRFTTFDMPS
jgi:hypothetical protein